MKKHNVIWIASYPKSGNTWVHSVLRLAGKNYGFPQTDMDSYNILKKKERPVVCPAVNARFNNHPCVVLKTHSKYQSEKQLHCFPEMELVNAGFVYIYRNPLDVLLSYINFSRIAYKGQANNPLYKKNLFEEMLGFQQPYEYEQWVGMNIEDIPQKNLDHALDYFSGNGLSLEVVAKMAGGWLENTQSWIDAEKEMPGHLIRYEDCLEDPEQFVKLCDMFVFDREDVLSALASVNTRAKTISSRGNQEQGMFYNKMSAYYFVHYFSKEAINRFLNKHEATLKQLGYVSIFDLV